MAISFSDEPQHETSPVTQIPDVLASVHRQSPGPFFQPLSNTNKSTERCDEPGGNVGRRFRLLFMKYGCSLFNTPTRICILAIFALYAGVSIWGCFKLDSGLDVRKLAADDSYLNDFFNARDLAFDTYGDAVDVFFDNPCPQWWTTEAKTQLLSLHDTIANARYSRDVVNGMHKFLSSPMSRGLYEERDLHERMLKAWLTSADGMVHHQDFVWNNSTGHLETWKFVVYLKFSPDSKLNGQYMEEIRSDARSQSVVPATCYSKMFTFYESDVHIVTTAVKNMAYTGVAVMLISLLLLPSIAVGALVLIAVLFIDIGVIGFMSLWGLKLNMLTLVNLIISVGFSVDYTTHICHTYCHCMGKTRPHRAAETLVIMGNAILHGAVSTQLGVTMLAFANSYVLRVFFKMMTLVLIFGGLSGVVFLPLTLSLIGPLLGSHGDDQAAQNMAKTISPRRRISVCEDAPSTMFPVYELLR
eukprot:GHVO01058610.1.p1 GENE.GHVO01058610.1~~GHVO01058610.1.p1  ORF type:complete len:506 (+),score=64.12 GHVO01058610.1:108-1520(+)